MNFRYVVKARDTRFDSLAASRDFRAHGTRGNLSYLGIFVIDNLSDITLSVVFALDVFRNIIGGSNQSTTATNNSSSFVYIINVSFQTFTFEESFLTLGALPEIAGRVDISALSGWLILVYFFDLPRDFVIWCYTNVFAICMGLGFTYSTIL